MKRIKCLSIALLALVMVFAGTTVMAQQAKKQKSPERIQKMQTIKANTAAMHAKLGTKHTSKINVSELEAKAAAKSKAENADVKRGDVKPGGTPVKKNIAHAQVKVAERTKILENREVRIQRLKGKVQRPQRSKDNLKIKPNRTKEDILNNLRQN